MKKLTLLILAGFILVLMALPGTMLRAAEEKASEEAYVKVPETIVTENIPPIPVEIKEKMKQYREMRSASFVDWDPRGKGMLVRTRTGNTIQLCWLEKPMGQLKQLTDFKEPVTRGYFSPDPEREYFLFAKDVGGGENYQFFKYDLKTGKSVMITDGKSRHQAIVFNHKGDRFAYANNSRTGMLFDVYVMDPDKPTEAKLVYQAGKPAYYIPAAWLHDHRHLLVIEYMSANKAGTLLVDTVSGKFENLTPESDKNFTFFLASASNDDKYLYGSSDQEGEFNQLIRYERATKKIEVITRDIPWDIDEAVTPRDMKRAVFQVNEDGISRLYLLDPDTLKYKAITSIPEGIINGIAFDPAGKKLLFNISNARMYNDAFHLDLETMKLVRWTESDTAGLDLSTFPTPHLIHYPTFDKVEGKTRMIPAFYYRPTRKATQPFPVLLYIHGGPEGQDKPGFQGTYNYFINELGMAVICPNVRGSAGYGKSYLMLDNAEKREDSVKDIGALLDWIATRPELDKNRVAVYGGSYGGYMVLASMVHYSDRLACGVDIVGISNFVTFLKNTSDYRRDLRRSEYGDERKIGEFLNKISPLTNAHKIKKPLLVIQGKNDPRVPLSEAEQIVATVKKNNVPVWYLMATNEGHGFRKKYNSDYMYYAVVRFLQEYLLK
ncbi:MAG: prolyl oligopeptidase family serine peptidase [Candidatus Aminicenantes bacterium]|jgi:dipeptidyl aminopeptidase/acylaminoacyl peptidase